MLQTEFLRNLNCNYERILLDKNPEEKKYQYCMVGRGGIKGLLPCSLRYINGVAYLYYDITSKQNVAQIYGKRPMTRQWLKDFVWCVEQIREELSRFLLDERNVLWYPKQIYQDVENKAFSFLYIPYYEGDNGFGKMLEFLVEHIDYEDDVLVECVYKMYEHYEKIGQDYLSSQIFRDVEMLEKSDECIQTDGELCQAVDSTAKQELEEKSESKFSVEKAERKGIYEEKLFTETQAEAKSQQEIKGFRSIFRNKKRKDKEMREEYQSIMQPAMAGYAVAEETPYEEEEWGRTVYVEEVVAVKDKPCYLYTPEGRVAAKLDKDIVTIGKRKEEVDVVLEDISVSRIHAQILKEDTEVYLEDLNSTNGTYKNGLRLQPYEKRKLEIGDEIRIGKKEFIYR